MSTNRENILQAVREWFKSAIALTDAQIIPADDKGTRPPLPYLTVKVITADIPLGTDELIREVNGVTDVPTVRSRGLRFATVSINGFGADTAGMIEVATLRLGYDSILRQLADAGLAVINRGAGVTDLSVLIDTEIEPRFQRDFEISYSVLDTDAEDLVEATEARVDLTLEDLENDPDPLVTQIVITL